MFTREEVSRLKHEFWTTFGKYMGPVLSAEASRVNWVNYHTGVKDVYFRMEASQKSAGISITFEHRDPDVQELYFRQLEEFKEILHETLGESWEWQLHGTVDGKLISRVFKDLPGAVVVNKEHWADLISFFKPRIIALDAFWENAKYGFESLR